MTFDGHMNVFEKKVEEMQVQAGALSRRFVGSKARCSSHGGCLLKHSHVVNGMRR